MTDKCDTFVARWDHAMCSRCGEEHDRPAPTPTTPGLDGFMADRGHPYMTPSEVATAEAEYHAPAPGLDLEEIERAERAMTPGPKSGKLVVEYTSLETPTQGQLQIAAPATEE